MNSRGEGISPVRAQSKLKKRRRQRESEVLSTCSLQSIPAAGAASSLNDLNKKRSKNDQTVINETSVGALDIGAQYTSSLLQKENNTAYVASKPTSLLEDRNKGLTDPSREASVNQGEKTTSKLSFIDEMDLTHLSTIGKEAITSLINVESELEMAFASSNDSLDTSDKNNVFYHHLIGRIGPPHVRGDNEAFSIGFPRCNTSNDNYNISSQTMDLKRQTCYGMSIPLSWCQFPRPKSKHNKTKTTTASPIMPDVTDQIDSITNELAIEDAEEDVIPSSPLKYQGRIRITSYKGATIREVFDIDDSDYVIGKLSEGDERYFLEKKVLPAPPSDSEDDESGSEDEDCVAVGRYKIVLNEHDCIGCSHEFAERDTTSGKMVGWISDRGRLANDPYFILKELDDMNA